MRYFYSILFLLFSINIQAQVCAGLNFQLKSEIPSTCPEMTMTMRHDALDRPYLYVAQKEAGLKVYDISDISAPNLVKTIPITQLNNLHLMNISQSGNYLYLALGNHFGSNTQKPGMAVIDVSTPASASVMDVWDSPTATDGGCGIVVSEGNFAYVGAMKNGLYIMDISDKNNITFITSIKPDINYPTPNPNPDLYNARGMVVKNSIVYLCYDAGGLRIINATDKQHPKETGSYSNPDLNGKPRAYNNIVIDGNLAYIAADYCGMEALDITDTTAIKLHAWWNPWNCQTNPLNWFSSPGHANEIEMDYNNKLLFMSTGKSDLHVVDVSDPAHPDSCNYYGGVGNNIGTWGVNIHKGKLFLSYICAAIPFGSNWTGVKALSYTAPTASARLIAKNTLKIYPNPAGDYIFFSNKTNMRISILDISGRTLLETKAEANETLDISMLAAGTYFIIAQTAEGTLNGKFIKN